MNESLHKIPDNEECSYVGTSPAEVVSLRNKIYLVVTDCPEEHIQEFDIDKRGRLIREVNGATSDWRFESANRIGNWDRPSGINLGRDEEVTLEDEGASKFFTYDFGKAIVRYVEVLNQSRGISQNEVKNAEPVESGEVDTSDIDELAKSLGLFVSCQNSS